MAFLSTMRVKKVLVCKVNRLTQFDFLDELLHCIRGVYASSFLIAYRALYI